MTTNEQVVTAVLQLPAISFVRIDAIFLAVRFTFPLLRFLFLLFFRACASAIIVVCGLLPSSSFVVRAEEDFYAKTSPDSTASVLRAHSICPSFPSLCRDQRGDRSEAMLSNQIGNFFEECRQTPKMLNDKLLLRDLLYAELSVIFPACGLYVVGSSLNGFGNGKSDLDLCLMVTTRELNQRTEAIQILIMVMNLLSDKNLIKRQDMIYAKVPILRIEFTAPYENVIVDLNANNSVAIKNTYLLCHYAAFDWRVRPLASVIKEWAKRAGINNSNRQSFTSYSLVLMMIHYLQCGVEKPVLPSLQQKYGKLKSDVKNLNINCGFEKNTSDEWKYSDEYTLGDLLLGFLYYYAYTFNYNSDAISVRLGKKTSRAYVAQNRSPYNGLSQWGCVCIEEPFTMSNTAHSVYDETVFSAIKQTFKLGYEKLKETQDLDSLMKMEYRPVR